MKIMVNPRLELVKLVVPPRCLGVRNIPGNRPECANDKNDNLNVFYKAQEPLEVDGYRVRGKDYWHIWGR